MMIFVKENLQFLMSIGYTETNILPINRPNKLDKSSESNIRTTVVSWLYFYQSSLGWEPTTTLWAKPTWDFFF